MALALDAMGVDHGERVAIVSPNAARFLISFFGVSGYGRILVPVNFRLNADEIGYIVEHSGASVLLVDPNRTESLRGISAKHRIVLDGTADAELFAAAADGAQPAGWAGRRGRHRSHQLHQRHDGAGRRACSSRTATAG